VPTPGERRALLFIASVAALGVAARGWMALHPKDPGALAGNRTALSRQIEAVDSAVSASSSPRKPRAPRAARVPRTPEPRLEPAPRTPKSRARRAVAPDSQPRDPRQSYWDRSQYFDSVRQSMEAEDRQRTARRRSQSPSAERRLPTAKSTVPPVDLDVAGVDEAAAIPLLGRALARRIVADRIENGPFGSIVGLERVSGITPAFARRLAPLVTFSGLPRHPTTGETRSRSRSERRPQG
jgi:hypothetical protein